MGEPLLAVSFIGVLLASFILNVPLGLWRSTTKKFSLLWFVSIHLAVPLIYLLRVNLNLAHGTIPFFFAAAVIGQIAGGQIFAKCRKPGIPK